MASTSSGTYDPSCFNRIFVVEDRHFWFRARRRIISTIVSQLTHDLVPGFRVLEVGCGTGNILQALDLGCPRGAVIGMDLFAEGLHYARRRTSCPLVQGDIRRSPFNTQFHIVGIFDVLEHLPDDVQMLRDLYAMLTPGGMLILTVPANPSLWSYFDEASHHCRRYELRTLGRKLNDAGFKIEYITHYMASIFPLVWLARRLASLIGWRAAHKKEDRSRDLALREFRVTPVVNGLLSFLLAQEERVIAKRGRLPFGASLLAVARKHQDFSPPRGIPARLEASAL